MAQGGVTMLVVVTVLLALFHGGAPQGSGVAHSAVVDDNGVTSGECAYIDGRGQSIKIRYREAPNGQVEARADSTSVGDAVAELRRCRQTADVVGTRVSQQLRHMGEQISQQQQELQDMIFSNIPFNFFRRR